MEASKAAPHYAEPCGWNALLPRRIPHERLPREKRYCAIVVGAGYTGLGVARRLAELVPEKETLVIEASEIGEGSSARNSGFLSVNPINPHANAYGSADEDAARKVRVVVAGLDWLRLLVKDHKIDCDWDETAPRLTAAATARGERSARSFRLSLQKWGIQCLDHTAEQSNSWSVLTITDMALNR